MRAACESDAERGDTCCSGSGCRHIVYSDTQECMATDSLQIQAALEPDTDCEALIGGDTTQLDVAISDSTYAVANEQHTDQPEAGYECMTLMPAGRQRQGISQVLVITLRSSQVDQSDILSAVAARLNSSASLRSLGVSSVQVVYVNENTDGRALKGWEIALIVLGVVAIVALVGAAVYGVMRWRSSRREDNQFFDGAREGERTATARAEAREQTLMQRLRGVTGLETRHPSIFARPGDAETYRQ